MIEDLNQSDNAYYSFSHSEPDGKTISLSLEVGDGASWPNAVEAFLSFLEIVYGYPIKQNVLYDVDIYSHDMLVPDRLVYTNWKLKEKEDNKDLFEE